MNKKIGTVAAKVNIIAVAGFALSMLLGSNFLSYITSIFIALSFVPMMCTLCFFAGQERKTAGYASVAFAIMYATIILLVYFAQCTTVRMGGLSKQASDLLDYQSYGLFFHYDLMGYGLMALATFFAGLTIDVKNRTDRWLKLLLMIHGVFSITCFVMPILGAFSADMPGGYWIGVALLEFWCIYFLPVGGLTHLYIAKQKD